LACGIFASLGPRNVYKDILNNIVILIGHVVTKNKVEQMAYEAMFATSLPEFIKPIQTSSPLVLRPVLMQTSHDMWGPSALMLNSAKTPN
jgi:hypothetical protein